MSAEDRPSFHFLIEKLRRLGDIDAADVAAIEALPVEVETVARARYLVRDGDETVRCCLLLAGVACRHKTTSEGARQIVSFHLPGDILDVQHLLLPRADHNLQAITAATVAWIAKPVLLRLTAERPRIGQALWRDSLIDASIFREWVLNVGRRDARTRIAHMLCEFAARAGAIGLGGPEGFELPMTQEDIADATGLTPVHVNRMLQALGEEGLIVRKQRRIEIADWPRMRRVADFDPAYLHAAA
jgi:CRP-like cAMP-binding protein